MQKKDNDYIHNHDVEILNQKFESEENVEHLKIKKKLFSKKKIGVTVLALVLVLGLAGCSLPWKKSYRNVETKAKDITNIIDKYYLKNSDEQKIEDGVYKGIMESLDDPYSVYYTKKEYAKMQEETEGTYVGIGVAVSKDIDSGNLKVVKAFEGGPAATAGIQVDDFITKVNGEDIQGQDMDKIVSKIKGKEGTEVKITVTRPDSGEELSFTLKRKSMNVPTISYEMLKGDIGYIQITEFDQVTAKQYEEALKDLEAKGEKGLIVDVRDNPGGVLGTVVEMLQNMLPKGTIVYTEDKYGKGDTYTSDGTHEFKKPLVVLVNGNSASAAEIFTGAIKDYKIGTIVGTKTFGKGIVQRIFPLGDGTAVKLTVSKYFTPNGVCIHKKGIEPDVKIEYDKDAQTASTYSKDQDNQLQKAISVIKKEIN